MMNKSSCTCGRSGFDNVFDAVNTTHRRTQGHNFDPKFRLGGMDGKEHISLGQLLRSIYMVSSDEAVRDTVEEAYSIMYIAEMWPDTITAVSDAMESALEKGRDYDIRPLVYEIIKQEKARENK